MYTYLSGAGHSSSVDLHHIDADTDSVITLMRIRSFVVDADPDPTFHPDADPDPSFKIQ